MNVIDVEQQWLNSALRLQDAYGQSATHKKILDFAAWVYAHGQDDQFGIINAPSGGYQILTSSKILRDSGSQELLAAPDFDATVFYDPLANEIFVTFSGTDDLPLEAAHYLQRCCQSNANPSPAARA